MDQPDAPNDPHLSEKSGRQHVIVLGGGFGGLEFCKKLNDPERFHITLIDRQNHHLFQPLLYQVATAGLAAPEVAEPLRSILTKRPDLDVLMDEVKAIDLSAKTVTTTDRGLNYDFLVIALGVQTGYFGHDEWAEHTVGLKTLEDAQRIRRDVLMAYERAEASGNPETVEKLLKIIVVGGGPTGVELAGAFAELAHHVFPDDFRRIDPKKLEVVLIEALPRLLNMYSEDLSEYTKRKLEKMGVTVKVDAPVEDVGPGYVVAGGERIESPHIFWAAGVQAPKLTRDLGVETDKAGRIKVEKDLSIPGHPEAFVIGDIASAIDADDKPVPGLSPAAIQMGKHAAKVIESGWRKPFRYRDKGSMATIGRSAAVARMGESGPKFTGFIAWILWLFVHLFFLIGFRNRIVVLVQWIYSYINFKRGARIIIRTIGHIDTKP